MRTNISEHYLQVVQTWASLVAQLAKNPLAMQETPVRSWVGKIPWRRDRLPTPVFMGFPGGSDGKESACNAGNLGSLPGVGRSPGGEHAALSNILAWRIPMDRGAYSPWGHKELDTTE